MNTNFVSQYNLYKFTSIFLITLAIFSYFFGFYLDENSAGAGGHAGDFSIIYNNFQIFLKYDLEEAIAHHDYFDSRPPTSYILHKLFNPFAEGQINYRRSVFFISFFIPILFYFCLKQKFKNEENLLLILISSTIFLSPYFRTSAYWGLQENYGFIFLLLTFLSIIFLNKKNNQFTFKIYIQLLIVTFFSSACIYFDQKLIIIPIICFFKIILSNKLMKFKIFSIFCYFIFSLPYIYLIKVWGSLIPTSAAATRSYSFEDGIYLDHLGYALTIIAFYLLPLLTFKGEKLILLTKNLFLDKKNYLFIIFFFLYLIYLAIFADFTEKSLQGNGFVHKISILIFKDYFYRSIFIYFSFFISWLIILIYFDKKIKEYFILGYFFLLSIIIWPMYQEYFDPLIIILAFTFFSTKISPNYKNSIILFIYLSVLLVSANVYYLGWLN